MYSIFNWTKLSFRQNRAEGKEQTTANNAVYFDVNTLDGSPINIPTSTEHDDDNHQTQVYANTNTAINGQISDSQDNTYQNGTGVVQGATSQQNHPVPLVKNELYNSESQADRYMTDENEIYHEARPFR